jgi:hypothetical protein
MIFNQKLEGDTSGISDDLSGTNGIALANENTSSAVVRQHDAVLRGMLITHIVT